MLDKNNPCVSNLAQCGLTLEKLEKLSVKSNLGVSFTEDLGRFSKEELFKELQTVTDHYNNEAILTTIDIPFRIKDLNSMLHNYERYYYTKEANRVFNDILGFRSVYTNYDDVLAMELPEQFRISDMSHGKTIDDGYRGVHLHYQMDSIIILKYNLTQHGIYSLINGYTSMSIRKAYLTSLVLYCEDIMKMVK